MSFETRDRVTVALVSTAVVFLLVLLFWSAARTPYAAGTAAAFSGPMIALFLSARQFSRLIVGLGGPNRFAENCLVMWNANQPVLYGLYAGGAALVFLLVIVSLKLRQDATAGGGGKGGSAAVATVSLLAFLVSLASLVAFINMNRLVLALVDPVESDPISRSIHSLSIGAISDAVARHLLLAICGSVVSALLLVLTIALSFALGGRRRSGIVVLVVALAVMVSAAFVERSWSEVLATAARTGRVPSEAWLAR